MNSEKKYLRPNVVMEPLISDWYAWSHLVSPATAALNITERHLAIIDSYLMAPHIHDEAVRNPKMRGGPFMDFNGVLKLNEIKKLRDDTVRKRKKSIELSQAIRELDRILLAEKGHSLEGVYQKIPELLKGYVELYYDRNNNASFRFFESLLYQGEFYDKSAQSIALWITDNDHRPFCFSTPRLAAPHVINLPFPFDHHGIDELAKMKRTPGDVDNIAKLLGLDPSNRVLFESFFTSEAPPVYSQYKGDKIRMRYFGHACILIETKDVSILVDPLISYYGYFSDVEHFSDADLPEKIDYVLITHNHQDHILFETILPLRHRIGTIVVPGTNSGKVEDPDLKLMLNNMGFRSVIRINEMETIDNGHVRLTGIPFMGEHSDLNILTKICHLVEVDGFKLLFLADSRIMEPSLYRNVEKLVGQIDVMFLGMECDGAPLSWLYGPLMPKKMPRDQDSSRRLSGSDCLRGLPLVDIFKPKEVYVYAMGQEPWVEFITSVKYTDESNPIIQSNNLVNICRDRGLIAERLFGEKELLYERKTAPQFIEDSYKNLFDTLN